MLTIAHRLLTINQQKSLRSVEKGHGCSKNDTSRHNFIKSMPQTCDWSLRLHTVMESDKICVLDKGRLVEEGSPKVSDQIGFLFSFSMIWARF